MMIQIIFVTLIGIILFIFCQNHVECSSCKRTKIHLNNKKEYMTLKTVCDVTDRDCSVACRTANGVFVKKCFIECQKNSPIC